MACVASACRQTSRLAARYISSQRAAGRVFSSSSQQWAASNFVMPAMSPTMTEGNIASWKVKEGDSYSTGDVLLEIETDKATMDVEAQEDGIVAKIIEQDGAKAVKVGSRIAVLAEAGDDIQSLEMPAEDKPKAEAPKSSSSSTSPTESTPQKAPEKKSTPQKPADHKPTSSSDAKPQKYPLYPSVQHLLHTNGIDVADASKIPATGPGGRLLKGDVLAYLGSIEKSYSAEQSKRITKLGHLDLSNIKPAKKESKSGPAEQKPAKAAQEEELPVQVAVPVSLAAVFATQNRIQESLGLTLPLATFIARASEIANENLPRAKGQAATSDELFDAVLGLSSAKTAFGAKGYYIPHVTALPPAQPVFSRPSGATRKPDIIDILSGVKPSIIARAPHIKRVQGAMGVGGAENIFSVSAPKNEEKRARVYLERVKTILEAEPGRCVL